MGFEFFFFRASILFDRRWLLLNDTEDDNSVLPGFLVTSIILKNEMSTVMTEHNFKLGHVPAVLPAAFSPMVIVVFTHFFAVSQLY